MHLLVITPVNHFCNYIYNYNVDPSHTPIPTLQSTHTTKPVLNLLVTHFNSSINTLSTLYLAHFFLLKMTKNVAFMCLNMTPKMGGKWYNNQASVYKSLCIIL